MERSWDQQESFGMKTPRKLRKNYYDKNGRMNN